MLLSRIPVDLLPPGASDALKEKRSAVEAAHDAYDATLDQPVKVRGAAKVALCHATIALADQYLADGKAAAERADAFSGAWKSSAERELITATREASGK